MKYLHVFTMLLITLKLLGLISVSWLIVFSPSILWLVIVIILLLIVIGTGSYKQ